MERSRQDRKNSMIYETYPMVVFNNSVLHIPNIAKFIHKNHCVVSSNEYFVIGAIIV